MFKSSSQLVYYLQHWDHYFTLIQPTISSSSNIQKQLAIAISWITLQQQQKHEQLVKIVFIIKST